MSLRGLSTKSVILLIFLILYSYGNVYAQEKQSVAILDFEGLGISDTEVRALTNRLRGNLVNTGKYQLIERGKMDEILKEQGFQLSGCTSEGCMVEAGQLLGVELMLAGSISLIGSTYSVEMRMIDVETGKIVNSAAYDMVGKIDDLLTTGMENAVNVLLGKSVSAPKPAVQKPVVPKVLPATLSISSTPLNAQVFINEVEKGYTPLSIEDLPVGQEMIIRIQLDGYDTYNQKITLTPGRNTPLKITLQRKSGLISVSGTPSKAKIYLDNKYIGRLPLENTSFPIGEWKLKAKRPEYKPFFEDVVVADNGVKSVVVKMDKQSKAGPLVCSLILPGTGQLIQHRTGRSLLFIAATAGAGMMVMTSMSDFTSYQDEYETNLAIHTANQGQNAQPDLLPAQRQAVLDSFNNMKEAEKNRNTFLAALGGIWTINVIDILF